MPDRTDSPDATDTPPRACDGKRVGVVLTNAAQLLVIDQVGGVTCPTAHLDDTTPADAARVAVADTGLTVVALAGLTGGWCYDRCRRGPGPRGRTGHSWNVLLAAWSGTLIPVSADDGDGPRWMPREELQQLADRTAAYARGLLPPAAWKEQPGIDPVWVQWLAQAELIKVNALNLRLIDKVAEVGT